MMQRGPESSISPCVLMETDLSLCSRDTRAFGSNKSHNSYRHLSFLIRPCGALYGNRRCVRARIVRFLICMCKVVECVYISIAMRVCDMRSGVFYLIALYGRDN